MATNASTTLARISTGQVVLTLQASDQDAKDNASGTFGGTFQFVTGTNDNAQFSISGANLRYDGETSEFRGSHLPAQLPRGGSGPRSHWRAFRSTADRCFSRDVNEQPTLQVPPTASFDENTANESVALLVASDPDAGDQLTAEFASGTNDNSLFNLLGNYLYYVGPPIDLNPAPSTSSASRYKSGTPAA